MISTFEPNKNFTFLKWFVKFYKIIWQFIFQNGMFFVISWCPPLNVSFKDFINILFFLRKNEFSFELEMHSIFWSFTVNLKKVSFHFTTFPGYPIFSGPEKFQSKLKLTKKKTCRQLLQAEMCASITEIGIISYLHGSCPQVILNAIHFP